MRCKTCGKTNQCGSKNTSHSWVVSQQCGKCHYLGMKTAHSNYKQYGRGERLELNCISIEVRKN